MTPSLLPINIWGKHTTAVKVPEAVLVQCLAAAASDAGGQLFLFFRILPKPRGKHLAPEASLSE